VTAAASDRETVHGYGRGVWQIPIWICSQAVAAAGFAAWVSLRLPSPVAAVLWPFLLPIVVATGANAFAVLRAARRLRPVVVTQAGVGHPASPRRAAVLLPWSRVASVREVPSVFAWSAWSLLGWPAPWPRALIVRADDGGELWIEGSLDGFEELESALRRRLPRAAPKRAPASWQTLELRLAPRTRVVGLSVVLGILGFLIWLAGSSGWPPTPLEAVLVLGLGIPLSLAAASVWRSTQVRYELRERVLRRYLPLAPPREMALAEIGEIHADRSRMKQRFEVLAAGRGQRLRRLVLIVEPGRDEFVRELAARSGRRPTWIDRGRELTRWIFPPDP
jgi:hypothetical protein